MSKNPHAQALGRLGKGKPKRITEEDRQARTERIARAREMLRLKRESLVTTKADA